MKKPKVVFFGNEKLATGIKSVDPIILNAVASAGFEIEKHVTGKLDELGDHDAQLAVLAAYGRIIPQTILDEFPLGIINVHPSLLPVYRGPTPIEQAILDGDTKTGVSIMQLTAGMDEGPIYKQKTENLTGKESKAELTLELQKIGAEMLLEVLPGIANGSLKPRQQPHPIRTSYSRKLTKADGNLDFSKPAEVLEREIRAFIEWPKSSTKLANIDVIITQASVIDYNGETGQSEIIDHQLIVYCSEKALKIEKLKPTGKPEMTGEAFIAGYGSRLN
ncbi:MAG: methionyl-tRNA formyltransferase [bacterium]|nr:methionyl-tRNA formyltransferase [bacterium]